MFIFSPAENLCSPLLYIVHSPLVTQFKTATVSKSFLGLAAMVRQSSHLHDAWDWLAFTHGTKNQPWCAWYIRRLLQMISHRFNIVSKTVAVEVKHWPQSMDYPDRLPILRPYGLPSALKIMPGQWTMSGQNGILTVQELHSPVMLTGQTDSYSWTNSQILTGKS